MKKFKISKSAVSRAKLRADSLPLLNNSIRKGEGSLVAYIGEEVAKAVLGGEIKDTYDYDLKYGNKTVDVKTKERTVEPRPHYNCTVADFNTTQDCDEYAFVSVLSDLSYAWYLGKINKKDFYKKAKFFKKGELDPDSPPNRDFYFRADCYNIPIRELNIDKKKDLIFTGDGFAERQHLEATETAKVKGRKHGPHTGPKDVVIWNDKKKKDKITRKFEEAFFKNQQKSAQRNKMWYGK